jgi:hypothetical protein
MGRGDRRMRNWRNSVSHREWRMALDEGWNRVGPCCILKLLFYAYDGLNHEILCFVTNHLQVYPDVKETRAKQHEFLIYFLAFLLKPYQNSTKCN